MAWLAVLALVVAQPASAAMMALPMVDCTMDMDAGQSAEDEGSSSAPMAPSGKPDCLSCVNCVAVAAVAVAAVVPIVQPVSYAVRLAPPPPTATLIRKPYAQAPPRPPSQAPPILLKL